MLPGLKSSGRINSPFGEKAFSILLFQDLAIVPMITIVAVLSRAPADPSAPSGWQMAFFTLWAIIVLVLAGRFIVNPLLRIVDVRAMARFHRSAGHRPGAHTFREHAP